MSAYAQAGGLSDTEHAGFLRHKLALLANISVGVVQQSDFDVTGFPLRNCLNGAFVARLLSIHDDDFLYFLVFDLLNRFDLWLLADDGRESVSLG